MAPVRADGHTVPLPCDISYAFISIVRWMPGAEGRAANQSQNHFGLEEHTVTVKSRICLDMIHNHGRQISDTRIKLLLQEQIAWYQYQPAQTHCDVLVSITYHYFD